MTEIERFTFDGDALEVIPEDHRVLVVVRRVCEALGIALPAQLRRLKRDPVICVIMMITQVPGDDQRREIACIDLRSVPLWLAKIHPSKVRPELRPKLVRYQREAAEVLADHFLGPRAGPLRVVAAAGLEPSLQAVLRVMGPPDAVREAASLLPPPADGSITAWGERVRELLGLYEPAEPTWLSLAEPVGYGGEVYLAALAVGVGALPLLVLQALALTADGEGLVEVDVVKLSVDLSGGASGAPAVAVALWSLAENGWIVRVQRGRQAQWCLVVPWRRSGPAKRGTRRRSSGRRAGRPA